MSLHDVLETVNDNPATLQPMENKQTDMAFDQYKPNYSFILLHSPVSSDELFPTSTVGAFDGLVLRPDPVQEAVIGDPSYPSIQALGDFSANRSFKIDGDSRSFSMIGYSVSYLGRDDQAKSFHSSVLFCWLLYFACLRVIRSFLRLSAGSFSTLSKPLELASSWSLDIACKEPIQGFNCQLLNVAYEELNLESNCQPLSVACNQPN
jgi:hypothetical protein